MTLAAGFLDLVAHVRGQRPGLAVRGAGGDDHAVEQIGLAGGVEDPDVLGLDVVEGVDDDALQFSEIHPFPFDPGRVQTEPAPVR